MRGMDVHHGRAGEHLGGVPLTDVPLIGVSLAGMRLTGLHLMGMSLSWACIKRVGATLSKGWVRHLVKGGATFIRTHS